MGKAEKVPKRGNVDRKVNEFSGEVVADARFSKVHNDPRFQRLPKHKAKVPIDSRFAHMFHDEVFVEKEVDKRGGRRKGSKKKDFLRRYYKYDEGEEPGRDVRAEAVLPSKEQRRKSGSNSRNVGKRKSEDFRLPRKSSDFEISSSDSEVGEESEKALAAPDLQRPGEGVKSVQFAADGEDSYEETSGGSEGEEEKSEVSVEDEESSSSSSDSESEGEEEEGKSEEKVATTENESKRLAIMNMDWQHIRAVDLLVVLRSFQPKGGSVESVTIFPSEFGIEQMAKEAVQGPQEIFTNDEEESEDDTDPEKLRDYEKAKLRYYYGVAVCDSVATASSIYNSCDGLEFEKTSNTLDLRFIPDDMQFVRESKDTASDIPVEYKPVEFQTRALQHSNVKLTWDDDEPVRSKALRRKFTAEQLNEQDYRDYVASSSSESEGEGDTPEEEKGEDKEKLREKYRSLLTDLGDTDENKLGKKKEKGNIEIKFNTGLDELSEKLAEKMKTKTAETVWEAYLRKKKEKKKGRKKKTIDDDSDAPEEDAKGGDNGSHDPFFSHDEDPFDDPFFQDGDDGVTDKDYKGKELEGSTKIGLKFGNSSEERRKRKEEASRQKLEEERRKAELELLLLDDDMIQDGEVATKGQKENANSSKEKRKKKRGKIKSEATQVKLAAAANYDDPRFSSLYTSHHFAIDPTDPQYKKSAVNLSKIAAKQRDRIEFRQDENEQEEAEKGGGRKRKAELSMLVRSLKSKVQARR